MRQHKAICAVGSLTVVGVWHSCGGWCDHTGSLMADTTEKKQPPIVRSNIRFQQRNVSSSGMVAVLKQEKGGQNLQSKNK